MTRQMPPTRKNHSSSMIDTYPSSYPTKTPLIQSQIPIPKEEVSGFKYLENPRDFFLSRPEFPIPALQDTFGNLYVRYDFALQVRLKVDEKLCEFKSVLGAHPDLNMNNCFQKWNKKMTNPKYTISYTKTARRDVKSILIRADDIPRNLWPAQKFIREVLDACHLFMEQHEFLRQVINEWLNDIEKQTIGLQETLDNSSLRSADRRHVLNIIPVLKAEYIQTIDWVKVFYDQITVLLDEIRSSTDSF